MDINRRNFIKLVGLGSAVFVLGTEFSSEAAEEEFYFVQLSDTHWGFAGPKINPDSTGTLIKAIDAVNKLEIPPDFVVFTGDITHTTDDPKERRKRMGEARDIINGLKVKNIKFLPGEHDAGLDNGEAFQEYFGKTRYTFEHKGINFIVIDNVSAPTSSIGDAQLQWLSAELGKLKKDSRIVVFTHRPLFDLYPDWDWWTSDGAKAVDLLKPYQNVTVFYGHIHQENHHNTEQIAHHSAKSLIFPLPAPGSVPKRVPIPWDPARPYEGLGFREVESKIKKAEYIIKEFPIKKG
jgi:3',5'-cyclic AMP phosphodiesterase CpdA